MTAAIRALPMPPAFAAAVEAEMGEVREALRDVTNALEPHVETNAKYRKPYEHPLSAYDRARALLSRMEGKP